MMKRAIAVLLVCGSSLLAEADRHTLLIHRIGPAASTIQLAAADGADERTLLTLSALDYNASLSADGKWVVFTSERGGSADIYRVAADGSGLEQLTDDPAYDDQAALSPDGTQVAFVSSRGARTTDIWILDVTTRRVRNLTNAPGGDFRPSWSPDGRRLAFSSDRGTEIERNAPAWEHLQRASIYVMATDGTGLQRLTSGDRFAGSPSWSRDGQRIAFYEMAVADTHKARGSARQSEVVSQIVSVDLAGGRRVEHTSGPGLKITPQFVGVDRLGYLVKAGARPGIAYTTGELGTGGDIRNPTWSATGSLVAFGRGLVGPSRRAWSLRQALFSSDATFDLAHASSLAALSRDGRHVAFSQSIGSDEYAVNVVEEGETAPRRVFHEKGTAALAPQWSPDGNWIAFGLGPGFESRDRPARIMVMRPDGSDVRTLASDHGAGFPSFSPDGKRVVYRVWGPGPDQRGLRILDLETSTTTRLTSSDYDTFPGWSPTGDLIAFSSWRNGDFDIFTIKPDGTRLKRLTTAAGNDAHSSWSPDGQFLMFSSSRYGFKDEAPLADGQPQPYGEIFIMNADGSNQRPLTDNQWEDGPGAWQPARASK